ncbi:UDP-glucose 4-epimerase GalE [Deinococcus radiophilus]|uniref:UDP-glucose 4-epimerase n=1 Tax=Deinococcus radiophilus TaxID=32062 RepID=A0A431VQT6_9DEIO|nr:UDP-glucose 4-epimerase GalE [Deinococcus radiophilus]RTR25494.1 UDP-glucose 4-epimerase GalE [Deinococcus radiophilus]UFA51740.1 UDP-glucose 4-epimerase GalE [Deinococcus radiophilus]
MKVLVTGGAGYIGSTTCAALEDAGHQPVVLDSLVLGREEFTQGRIFYRGDVGDRALLHQIFSDHPDISATLHFAARIVVPESVAQPELYYRENVVASLNLFAALRELGQSRVIFSSSASLYATPDDERVTEDSPLAPSSPYARSKLMTEQMLADLCAAAQANGEPLRGIALRYFNPIGADPARRSGPYLEDPANLLGRMLSAMNRDTEFRITGTDYATRDGTGLRDYIHVWDLAQAHVRALEGFETAFEQAAQAQGQPSGLLIINVGTGQGQTVRELVQAFQAVAPRALQVEEGPRRPGDVAGAYADITRAREWLDWSPQLSTEDALRSALDWTAQWQRRSQTAEAPTVEATSAVISGI